MRTREQSSFSAEDVRVKRPVKVAESVIKIVSEDAYIQELLKDEPSHELPEKWLSASEVHLGGREERDLVVMGTGLIRGANVTTFWIFVPGDGAFKLVLETIGHDLVIKNTRSNGYRDVEVSAATAVEFTEMHYRFEGDGYKKVAGKVEKIP
jgi:hypothetical protein